MDQRAIRALLTKVNELQRRQVRYRQGVVTDDSPLSVALGGSDVAYTGVAALPDTYAVGDPVAVLTFGQDLIVLGVINGPAPGGGSADGAPHTIQDEGTPLTQRAALDFVGSGVTATDDAGGGKTVVTIPGAATPKYQTAQDEGSALAQRGKFNFVGAGVTATDDAANDRTLVTVPGASGGITEYMRLRRATNLATATDGFPYVAWDAEDADPGGWHAANSTDWTVTNTGIYIVNCFISWQVSAAGDRMIRLNNNTAGTAIAEDTRTGSDIGSAQTEQGHTFTWIGQLLAATVYRIRVNQDSGGSLYVKGGALTDLRPSTLVVARLV